MARIAYLGTPEIALPPLFALVEAGHDVALVVTRPDKRRGRGAELLPSPAKAAAQSLGIDVTDRLADVIENPPDGAPLEAGVVVAYGRLIPPSVLATLPMINIHFSMLPRWRGAAPVERSILAGDASTGVSVIALDEGLDTGPIYASRAVAIREYEHLGELQARLAKIGSDLVVDLLADGVGALPDPKPQEGEPTYAEKIQPGELELHWERPAEELARIVRLDRAFTTFRNRRLMILEAVIQSTPLGVGDLKPGSLVGESVSTGEGMLQLVTVKPEGRRAIPAHEWLRGARVGPEEKLG